MKTPEWAVVGVQPLEDYKLKITFSAGVTKIFDAKPLLHKRIYAKLNNISYFNQAKAKYDTVVWDEDTDIAPEYLYENSI